MRLYHLFEDAMSDREYRKKANTVLNALKKELESTHFSRFTNIRIGGKSGKKINTASITPVLSQDFNIVFIEDWAGSDKTRKGGFGVVRGQSYVFIFIDPNNQEDLPVWQRRDWYDVFIHETIHHLDSSRNHTITVSGNDHKRFEDYVNSPEEFNAFYQQAIYATEKAIENIKHHENYPKVAKMLFGDVDKFTKYVMNKIPKEISGNLDKKYMRKFKKRVAQYYETFKDEIIPS